MLVEVLSNATPKGQLPKVLKWLNDNDVLSVLRLVQPAMFVGGAVRDGILGIDSLDIDIATCMTAKQAKAALSPHYKVVPLGEKFGSVKVVLPGGYTVDVTTLRKDVETDGRRAKIQRVDSWHEDSRRRDFTFNALYCDAGGAVYDYWDGIDDLARGVVKFIGRPDQRIAEDYLRILRFYRFTALYGGARFDLSALSATKAAAASLAKLSKERVAQEMWRIIASPHADTVLRLMADYGVLRHVMPCFSYDRLCALRQLVFIETRGLVHPLLAPKALRRVALVDGTSPWILKKCDRDYMKLVAEKMAVQTSLVRLIFDCGPELAADIVLLKWSCERGRNDRPDNAKYIAALDFIAAHPKFDNPAKAADFPDKTGKSLGEALKAATDGWLEQTAKNLGAGDI
ncbi:MAG: hypothetical protein FWF01_02410 [Alphaproteobacteria bacterium]|nr:hypothetical protein [Alphaproteobacteria bacterium]